MRPNRTPTRRRKPPTPADTLAELLPAEVLDAGDPAALAWLRRLLERGDRADDRAAAPAHQADTPSPARKGVPR
jgi:hypothetical protein